MEAALIENGNALSNYILFRIHGFTFYLVSGYLVSAGLTFFMLYA